MLARPAPRRQIVTRCSKHILASAMPSKILYSQVFVCSFVLVSHWSKNKRGTASVLFKPEIWSAGADNGKTTIVIDPALPPQNTETFRFPTCLAATAHRSVQFFPYPVGRTTKTCWPAALQHSKHINAWVLGFKFREPRFLKQNAMWYRTRCLYCTHQSMSDFGHAQLPRGPDSGPRNRILPDLVSSSPFSYPLPCFFVLEPPKRDLGTRSVVCCVKLNF